MSYACNRYYILDLLKSAQLVGVHQGYSNIALPVVNRTTYRGLMSTTVCEAKIFVRRLGVRTHM